MSHLSFTCAEAYRLSSYNALIRSTTQALHHPYFRAAPPPTPYTQLPTHPIKAPDRDDPAAHPLLSDSKEKNNRRVVGARAGGGAGTAVTGAKRQLAPEELEERKRIARKLAFD